MLKNRLRDRGSVRKGRGRIPAGSSASDSVMVCFALFQSSRVCLVFCTLYVCMCTGARLTGPQATFAHTPSSVSAPHVPTPPPPRPPPSTGTGFVCVHRQLGVPDRAHFGERHRVPQVPRRGATGEVDLQLHPPGRPPEHLQHSGPDDPRTVW